MALLSASNEPSFPSGSFLSKEQEDVYWDQGYLVIRKLYDLQMINQFRDRFIEICHDRELAKQFSVVKDPSLHKQDAKPEAFINKIQELMYDPVYKQYFEHPQTLDILTRLIGEDLTAVNCMLINKPPGTREHPPHQDMLYFPFRPADKIVGVWTAVDHVNKENGCLFVVPKSHKIDTFYNHCDRANEKKEFYLGVENEEVCAPVNNREHLEMGPGDTVFFHPYLVHGSGANISKRYRKAMAVHFANSGCYYVNVKGTVQEPLATRIERLGNKLGANIDYTDIWRIKCRQVQGVRSRL